MDSTDKTIDVLYVHPSLDSADVIIPMGMISLMNSVNGTKQGIYSFELSKDLINKSLIIVMDLHWFIHLKKVESLAKFIKSINRSVKIIIGGYTATIFANIIIKMYDVDYLIKGDAEVPFKLLVDKLINNLSPESVPNVVSKKFKNRQTYFIQKKDFNTLNTLETSWFLSFQKNISEENPLFIPITRGCIYPCSWCYGSKRNQRILCKRNPIIRGSAYVRNDFIRASRNELAKEVTIIGDFVDLYNKGMITKKYLDDIFSHTYNISLYYEFFNLPEKKQLLLFSQCFRESTLMFSLFKDHGQSLKMNDLNKMSKLLSYARKLNNIKIIILGDTNNFIMKKYSRYIKHRYNVKVKDDSDWKLMVPLPTLNRKEILNQFLFFYIFASVGKRNQKGAFFGY
jgi:hypothetical protein